MQARRPPGRPRKVEVTPRPLMDVVSYQVGRHEVRVNRTRFGWSATVGAIAVAGRFESLADAWAAAVREADRMDRHSGAALPAA